MSCAGAGRRRRAKTAPRSARTRTSSPSICSASCAADGQSEPEAAPFSALVTPAPEALEDQLALVVGDAGPVVRARSGSRRRRRRLCVSAIRPPAGLKRSALSTRMRAIRATAAGVGLDPRRAIGDQGDLDVARRGGGASSSAFTARASSPSSTSSRRIGTPASRRLSSSSSSASRASLSAWPWARWTCAAPALRRRPGVRRAPRPRDRASASAPPAACAARATPWRRRRGATSSCSRRRSCMVANARVRSPTSSGRRAGGHDLGHRTQLGDAQRGAPQRP